MRLQVLELDHVSEITQEVAAEVCREGLKGLEMLVLTATPVTPKALLHFNSERWECGGEGAGFHCPFLPCLVSKHQHRGQTDQGANPSLAISVLGGWCGV